jgi:hypothetical protein
MRSDRFDAVNERLTDFVFLQVLAQDMLRHRVIPPVVLGIIILPQLVAPVRKPIPKSVCTQQLRVALKSERALSAGAAKALRTCRTDYAAVTLSA